MKTFLAIALLCATSIAQIQSDEISCEQCEAYADKVQAYIKSERVAEDINSMVNYLICMGAEHGDEYRECMEFTRRAWTQIADAIFPKFIDRHSMCGEMGYCGGETTTPATNATIEANDMFLCPECKAYMDAYIEAMMDIARVEEIISFLQGEGFCARESDPAHCAAIIEKLMPSSLVLVAGKVRLQEVTLCCDMSISYDCCGL